MAAGRSAVLTVKILTDASAAGKGVQQAASAYEKFESGINRMVPAAAAVSGALVVMGTKAVNSASRTEQAMGALDSVFGKSSGTVKQWAADAATSVGLAESEYAEMASVIGAQLGNMGLSMQDSLSGTQDLISLGADLAATFGGTTTDAVNALTAALRGEADPAERYGLSLKVTDVNARLAEKGLSGLEGEALKTAKTQALLELATEQAGGALGQFGRESTTVSGQTQRLNAQVENAWSSLGTSLLPVVAAVAGGLADMAGWVGENSTLVLTLAGVVGGLAGAVLLISGAIKAWQAITTAYTAVQWLLNAAMSANPIGIVITLIAALVAAFVLLWNNSEGFRNFFIGMWEAIQVAIGAVVDWFGAAWGAIVDWFRSAWESVASFFSGLWAGIQALVAVVVNWFQSAWRSVTDWFRSTWLAVSTFFKALWAGIQALVTGVVDWFRSAWQTIVTWFQSVWQAVSSFFSGLWAGIKNVVAAVANWFQSIWTSISDFFSTLVTGWKIVVTAVFNAVRSVIDTVVNWFRSAWQTAVNAVSAVIRTIQNVISTVFNAVRSVVSTVTGFFKSAWNTAVSAVKSVVNTMKGVFTTVMNAIKKPIDAVKGAFDKVVGAVRSVIDWISRIKIPDILGGIGNLLGFSAASAPAAAAFSAAGYTGAYQPGAVRHAPQVRAVAPRPASGGGSTYNFYIDGALDPAATARQIRGLLTDQDRRAGGVVLQRRTRG